MKKIVSVIVATAITLTTLFSFSGCTDSKETEPKGLAIVLSHLRGFPNTSVNSDKALDLIQSTCESFGHIVAVEVSGDPQIVGDYRVSKPTAAVNQDKLDQIVRNSVSSLIAECDAAKAENPESDVLAAIRLASDSLRSMDNSEKNLLIYSNGISTTGVLSNTEQDWISAESETVVDKLESLHQIPSLENVHVVWSGLGCVAGDQVSPPESVKYRLKEHWRAILEKGGAEVVFDDTPIQGDEGENLPTCGVVQFVDDRFDVTSNIGCKFDGNSSVQFLTGKSEFVNPAEAENELGSVAEQLKANKNVNIVIVGTTSSEGNATDNNKLSTKRAEACKKILTNKGVEAERIQCLGWGSKPSPFRVEDLDANGNLIEENARKNRAIFILSADAAELKNFQT